MKTAIFSVEDMARTYKTLKAKGVTFGGEPSTDPNGIFAQAESLDGNTFVLHGTLPQCSNKITASAPYDLKWLCREQAVIKLLQASYGEAGGRPTILVTLDNAQVTPVTLSVMRCNVCLGT